MLSTACLFFLLNVLLQNIESFQYPPSWQEVENAFDARVGPTPVSFSPPSISKFNIYDLLVIRNWIGYGCGIGDNEAVNFRKIFGNSNSFEDLGIKRAAAHTFRPASSPEI